MPGENNYDDDDDDDDDDDYDDDDFLPSGVCTDPSGLHRVPSCGITPASRRKVLSIYMSSFGLLIYICYLVIF